MKKVTEKQFLKAMGIVKAYKVQCEQSIEEIDNEINDKSNVLLSDVHLSVRAFNAIKANAKSLGLPEYAKIKMYHFGVFSISELKRVKDFGQRSLNEIQDLCKEHGVSLKP